MADSTTAVEIFKPLDQDYALTGLRKLLMLDEDLLYARGLDRLIQLFTQ